MLLPILLRNGALSLRRATGLYHPKRFRQFKAGSQICEAHMNELPIPCIPWNIYYKGKQSYYNKVLAGGIAWFLFSFALMVYTESMYLNWGPPSQPGPPNEMADECADYPQ